MRGVLFFPFERASDVLHAWREWVPGVPEEVTSVGRLLQFPPFEDIPEPLRGSSFAVLEAVCMMGEEQASELLQPLRELGPAMDTFGVVPPAALADLHMDPPLPVPYMSANAVMGELPAETLDEIVATQGPGSDSPLLSVELRHAGGALDRAEPGHGALASLPGEFLAFAVGATPEEPMVAGPWPRTWPSSTRWSRPYASGRYLNFVEEACDLREVFGDEAFRRLQAVKAEYDPAGVFHANHQIAPAS